MVVVRLYPLGIRKSNGVYFVTPSGLEFSLAYKPERKLGATHIQALRACWRQVIFCEGPARARCNRRACGQGNHMTATPSCDRALRPIQYRAPEKSGM